MNIAWESELADFLTQLSAVQEETLQVLARRRELVVTPNAEGLTAVVRQEKEVIGKLEGCLRRRQELLKEAAEEGLPSDSLRKLAAALPASRVKTELSDRTQKATHRARLLQHHSLVNWVVAQRAILHLSQILEIIATSGKMRPTYGKDDQITASGALVDREV